jgi:hypothetical protein
MESDEMTQRKKFKVPRDCAVCGRFLRPFDEYTFTAHEFNCYKNHKDKIPAEHMETFRRELAGEARSNAAKRGVETRRKKGGKRAPKGPPVYPI